MLSATYLAEQNAARGVISSNYPMSVWYPPERDSLSINMRFGFTVSASVLTNVKLIPHPI
jgi:hypothetical protein